MKTISKNVDLKSTFSQNNSDILAAVFIEYLLKYNKEKDEIKKKTADKKSIVIIDNKKRNRKRGNVIESDDTDLEPTKKSASNNDNITTSKRRPKRVSIEIIEKITIFKIIFKL